MWQVKEALKGCTVGAVRIAIVQSVRGEVREFAAAVGFEASVEVLLEKIEDSFGEKWTADGLQQEFCKITQGRNEKVRQFAGRLEAQFKRLKEKVPGRYDNNILKEQFFHGMHQHLKDSIRFCYKKEETMYEELFHETVKAQKEKVPEAKITSLKAKSAIVEPAVTKEDNVGIQDLRQKINALTTAVKSSICGGARPKQPGNGGTPQKGKDKSRMNGSPYKERGPTTTSAGPFKPEQKHFQCYHCGGGDIVTNNVLARGHQLEDLNWG